MYNRVFKNNQVTYGRPFQVKIPITLQNIKIREDIEETSQITDDQEAPESPEYILEKAREEADMIIKEAGYEASRMIEDACTQAGEKAQAIEEEAWQKGYAEGLEAAQAQYEGVLREAQTIKESAEEEHDAVLAGLEAEIISMVMDVARKVIGYELSENRDNLLYLVREALEKCSNKSNIILKISLEDYEYMISNKEKLLSMVEGMGEIEIKQDLSLKTGACIVETNFGNVDAGAQTKLRKIEEAFMEVLEGK